MTSIFSRLRNSLFLKQVVFDIRTFRPRIFVLIFNLIPDFYSISAIRNLFLVLGGVKMKLFSNYIRSPLLCTDLRGISIGRNVFINMGCHFEGSGETIIGDKCQIGPYCCFETLNHMEDGNEELPIKLGKGVWLGAGVILTPGTTIGDNSIIAAGAVVTKHVPENEVWGGVPARKIRNKNHR